MKRISTFASVALLLVGLYAQESKAREARTPPAPGAAKKSPGSATREPKLTHARLVALARKKIKFVFIIYQENRSFDSYFGTFPGAEGLFASPNGTLRQGSPNCCSALDTDGKPITIKSFRIGPEQGAADTCDVDHSHTGLLDKMNIQNGVPKMDGFALAEEKKHFHGNKPTLSAKQFASLTMAYEDCDTVPFLWNYAHKFVLFDHIFQLMTGPSTPGNLSIIGAQTGATQWALHPEQRFPDNGNRDAGVPVLNDNDPFWGSPRDPTPADKKMPVNPRDFGLLHSYGIALNLTYATLPLTLRGADLGMVSKSDQDPKTDLADVNNDVPFISARKHPPVEFGWYEEGYDQEPSLAPTSATNKSDDDDPAGVDPEDAAGLHASYITHHNGPQYFGYIANNPKMREQLHGLGDFLRAIEHQALPAAGGVFYVKGGAKNIFGLKPDSADPRVQQRFLGDDDHPGYSDAHISEALVAAVINRIAASPYWEQCAIIITWDDSEGDYDHVPPPIRNHGPDKSAISDGPRVPLIFISPYARTGLVEHAIGDHASVVKFVDAIFDLPPLATLPDEMRARRLGEKEFGEKDLGPEDALTPEVTDLFDAFSPSRLLGQTDPLRGSYATIENPLAIPPPMGCKELGIVPTDRALKIKNEIPADFSARPEHDGSLCR